MSWNLPERPLAAGAGLPAVAVLVSAAAAGLAVASCGGQPPLEADLILRHAIIETGAGQVEALAVREGHVLATGDDAAVGRHRGRKTIELDLKGGRVAPGFTVPVADPLLVGERLLNEARGGELYLDLADAESVEDIVQRARARARAAGPGEWIFGRDWDETRWVAPRLPDKRLISDIVAYNPVFLLRRGGEIAWVNKQALDRAGLAGDGLLHGPSVAAALRRAPPVPVEVRQKAILAALDQAVSMGVTEVRAIASGARLGVRDPEASEEAVLGAWRALARSGRLPVGVSLLVPAPGAAAEAVLVHRPATGTVSADLLDAAILLDPPSEDAAAWCGRAKQAGVSCLLAAGGDQAVLQAAEAACRGAGLERVETLAAGAASPPDRFGEPIRTANPRALTPGERADFVLLGPARDGEQSPRILSTWVGGREVYRRAG
ncbi:MAG TPA: amidohydrolase family protein [Candidatus Polarisedimenticolia bacterium]|nr:amidohydrolase family protein [Candidatus Polarisedimenticolia bacterium]